MKHLKLVRASIILICVGAIIFLFLYEFGLTDIMKNKSNTDSQIKIACVGDSVTYGYGLTNQPKNNYPHILGQLLGENYHVNNYGISGSTVQFDGDQPYNNTTAYTDSLNHQCDILIFMLGSNDSKPENWVSEEKFKEDYLALLNTYIQKDGQPKIYLCTPPTAFFSNNKSSTLTSYDIQPAIVDEIADIVREIANDEGYNLIDINKFTEKREDLFSKLDHVHPNNDGAKAIAEEVLKGLK